MSALPGSGSAGGARERSEPGQRQRRLAGLAGQAGATPDCNTGVAVTDCVDYLSLTCATDQEGSAYDALLGIGVGEWESLPGGGHGYERKKQAHGVRVYYGESGSYCQVSGDGCRSLEAREVVSDWQEFAELILQLAERLPLKVKRLDFARDDRAGILDLAALQRYALERAYTSPAHHMQPINAYRSGRLASQGLTFGSRTSESYVRIYDKRLESAGDAPWVRVEVEFKGKKAAAAARTLAARGLGIVAGVIRQQIEFKVATVEGTNATRVAVLPMWEQFLSAAAKIVLAVTAATRSLETVEHWLEQQCGPLLATLFTHYGGDLDWLRRLAVVGRSRMRERHHRLLAAP